MELDVQDVAAPIQRVRATFINVRTAEENSVDVPDVAVTTVTGKMAFGIVTNVNVNLERQPAVSRSRNEK